MATEKAIQLATVAFELTLAGCGYVLWRRLRGTTLAAPAVWAVTSAVVLALVDASLAWRNGRSLTVSLCLYAAAVGTFCPLMAVLGAKRPQDHGWQWVVASLWLVLLVPAGQSLIASTGQRLELFAVWKILLVALIALGLLNYLPTRFAAAATLFAMGQTLLLGPFLWHGGHAATWRLMALAIFLGSAGVICALSLRGCSEAGLGNDASPALPRLNQRWRMFRDGWGAFWGLRIMQRVNQTAELSQWPVRLHWWTGFEPAEIEFDEQCLTHIEQTLDSLLWRFERR